MDKPKKIKEEIKEKLKYIKAGVKGVLKTLKPPSKEVRKERKIEKAYKKGIEEEFGVEFKKGGSVNKNWIQKAVNPKHKGFCTPMSKPTCTPKRKALAHTLRALAKKK